MMIDYHPCCNTKGKCICGYQKEHGKLKKEGIEMSVVVYFKNGSTALFQHVEDFDIGDADENSYVGFTYFGESTQVRRKAMFNLSNIAGFAKQI